MPKINEIQAPEGYERIEVKKEPIKNTDAVETPEGYEKIRVKVEDGVIVFPMEAKGKTVLVEGEVYAVTPANTCAEDCSDKEKEKEGEHKCAHEEVVKIYQIKGEGAVIKM